MLEWQKRNSTYHLSNLERTINEYEETLAQKRAEMAYLNAQSRKLRQRIVDYNTNNNCILSHTRSEQVKTEVVSTVPLERMGRPFLHPMTAVISQVLNCL
jgi:uncharacterized coiled-coil protein SlyX